MGRPITTENVDEILEQLRTNCAETYVRQGIAPPTLVVIDTDSQQIRVGAVSAAKFQGADKVAETIRSYRDAYPICCLFVVVNTAAGEDGITNTLILQLVYRGLKAYAMSMLAFDMGGYRQVGEWARVKDDNHTSSWFAVPAIWN